MASWPRAVSRACAPVFLCVLLSLALAGCSLADRDSSSQSSVSAPSAATAAAGRPQAPEQKQPSAADVLRQIAPPEGIKYTRLFTEKVKGDDARFRRLETAVQQIRDDLDTAMPSIVRLVAVEQDMKNLLGQLQTLVGEPGSVEAAPVDDVAVSATMETGAQASAGTPVKTAETAPEKTAERPAERIAGKTSVAQPADVDAAPVSLAPRAAEQKAEQKTDQNSQQTDLTAAAPIPSAATRSDPAPQQSTQTRVASVAISDIKVASSDKGARLTLRLSDRAGYEARVVDEGFRLQIDIKGAAYDGARAWEDVFAAFAPAWKVEKIDGGERITIDLLYPAKLDQQNLSLARTGQGYDLGVSVVAGESS